MSNFKTVGFDDALSGTSEPKPLAPGATLSQGVYVDPRAKMTAERRAAEAAAARAGSLADAEVMRTAGPTSPGVTPPRAQAERRDSGPHAHGSGPSSEPTWHRNLAPASWATPEYVAARTAEQAAPQVPEAVTPRWEVDNVLSGGTGGSRPLPRIVDAPVVAPAVPAPIPDVEPDDDDCPPSSSGWDEDL